MNNFGQIIEYYDLHGLRISGNTLTWPPFFTFKDCNFEGRNCHHFGLFHDFMDAAGKIMNFTWQSYKDPSGSWGIAPISGPFNKSGVWGGVMGSIVNGDYMVSLSAWDWNYKRHGLMDFFSISSDSYLLALTPKPPKVDNGLFVRWKLSQIYTDEILGLVCFLKCTIMISNL